MKVRRIFPWKKQSKDKFASEESYQNYIELMKCEECGQELQDGDFIMLDPYSTEPEDKRIVQARIVHGDCLKT